MNLDEVRAMGNEDLRTRAAELHGDWRESCYLWVHSDGSMLPYPPDYFNDIAAAMELAQSISDRYWMELHTPFRIGDPFFAGFTPLGTSGWNGCPDNQCEAEKPGEAITRAYVLTRMREEEEK